MRKMILGAILGLLVVGIMLPLAASAQEPTPTQSPDDPQPTYACSLKSGATPTITADQAKAAALAANPGTTALKAELDDENGCLVYGVELSNGADVKVDAGDGQVVHTEAAGPDDASEGAHSESIESESGD